MAYVSNGEERRYDRKTYDERRGEAPFEEERNPQSFKFGTWAYFHRFPQLTLTHANEEE